MPCTSPITGWKAQYVNPKTGKRPVVFNIEKGHKTLEVTLPCGRCISCRLEHSRQWAVRCMHEAQMHEENSFITLTYAPEHLPTDHSIHKSHIQKFFKRLRKRGIQFRYFACGEYGEQKGRPHYHAIIFGHSFPDKQLKKLTRSGDQLYQSDILDKTWNLGHAWIGSVTFQSAAYVARYVMKKRKGLDNQLDPKTGKTNKEYYLLTDPDTGEMLEIEPEFCLMSRGSGKKTDPTLWRYGLGKAWLEKYKMDTHKDFIVVNGHKMALPKYYDNILEIDDPAEMEERKKKRKSNINKEEQSPNRLQAKAKVKEAQFNQLHRNLEVIS